MTFDEWKKTGTNWCFIDVEANAREIWRAATEAEREACAVIAETPVTGEQDDITMEAKDRVAAAIRARSNAKVRR